MADAIGTISIAVAVLLIHALRKPVTIINAAIMFLGLVSKALKMFRANLLCRPVLSIALAADTFNPNIAIQTVAWFSLGSGIFVLLVMQEIYSR